MLCPLVFCFSYFLSSRGVFPLYFLYTAIKWEILLYPHLTATSLTGSSQLIQDCFHSYLKAASKRREIHMPRSTILQLLFVSTSLYTGVLSGSGSVNRLIHVPSSCFRRYSGTPRHFGFCPATCQLAPLYLATTSTASSLNCPRPIPISRSNRGLALCMESVLQKIVSSSTRLFMNLLHFSTT